MLVEILQGPLAFQNDNRHQVTTTMQNEESETSPNVILSKAKNLIGS